MNYIKLFEGRLKSENKYSISNNIFIIDRISKTSKKTLSQKTYYKLSYLNDKCLTWIEESDIAFCSKDIKECELFLAAKKYNI